MKSSPTALGILIATSLASGEPTPRSERAKRSLIFCSSLSARMVNWLTPGRAGRRLILGLRRGPSGRRNNAKLNGGQDRLYSLSDRERVSLLQRPQLNRRPSHPTERRSFR